MDYYCEVCVMCIQPKNKSRHFKSYNQNNLDSIKHIKLTNDNPNKDNIDKKLYTYINEYDNTNIIFLDVTLNCVLIVWKFIQLLRVN